MANISTIKVGSTSYGLTPASHASTATTYGAATASNYGHVKLSDNYASSAGAAESGIGASSLAVCDAYNTLHSKFVFETRTYASKTNRVIKIMGAKNQNIYLPKAPVTFIYGYTGYYCGKVEIFGWNEIVLTYGKVSGPTNPSGSSSNMIVDKAAIGETNALTFGASGGVFNFTPTLSGNTLILTQSLAYIEQSMFITAPLGSLTILH